MTQPSETDTARLKQEIRAYWETEPCGTRGVSDEDRTRFFDHVEKERYNWEPYIPEYARFERGRGKKVLEIGVGVGTDFINWVRHGAIATGIDLTERGVSLTKERLALEGLTAEVRQGDAETLPFETGAFDIVYSNGVLHVPPNPARAVAEAHRVLKPGGTFVGLIYNVHSWVGFMLWGIHCLAKGRPWKSPRWAIYHYLESPGTNAYTVSEARELFSRFSRVDVRTQLGHGDLLLMRPSAKYNRSFVYLLLWKLWPRWLIRRLGNRFGMALIIEAVK